MSPGDAEAVEHRDRVGDRAALGVGGGVGGHVRGRVAAGGVGDTAVSRGKEPDLRLPAAVIAGELLHEDQPLPLTGFLGVQRDAAAGHARCHVGAPGTTSYWFVSVTFTGSAPMMFWYPRTSPDREAPVGVAAQQSPRLQPSPPP